MVVFIVPERTAQVADRPLSIVATGSVISHDGRLAPDRHDDERRPLCDTGVARGHRPSFDEGSVGNRRKMLRARACRWSSASPPSSTSTRRSKTERARRCGRARDEDGNRGGTHDPLGHRPEPPTPRSAAAMRSKDDQVGRRRRLQDRVDRRLVRDDRVDPAGRWPRRRTVPGGRRRPSVRRRRSASSRAICSMVKVRRRLEPFGVHRAEPRAKCGRDDPADGQRPRRRLAEVHGHQDRLGRTLPRPDS